ncbi:unnamed protein product, partial [Symbiodinium pilosum]
SDDRLAPLDFQYPPGKRHVGLVPFYFPSRKTEWDRRCGGAFLGNFYEAGYRAIRVKIDGRIRWFSNAESAFQATKFKDQAWRFEQLSGEEAFQLKRRLRGSEDWDYGGHGSNWNAMWQVLQSKFWPGTKWASKLLETDDAFLLEHNEAKGRDEVWSDDCDGEGHNWLGLQLMILRENLKKRCGRHSATWGWLCKDPLNGRRPHANNEWKQTVRRAATRACQCFCHVRAGQGPPQHCPSPRHLPAVTGSAVQDRAVPTPKRKGEIQGSQIELQPRSCKETSPVTACASPNKAAASSSYLFFDYEELENSYDMLLQKQTAVSTTGEVMTVVSFLDCVKRMPAWPALMMLVLLLAHRGRMAVLVAYVDTAAVPAYVASVWPPSCSSQVEQEAVAIDAEGTKQSVRAFTIDILTMSVTTDMDIYVYVFDIKKLGQQAFGEASQGRLRTLLEGVLLSDYTLDLQVASVLAMRRQGLPHNRLPSLEAGLAHSNVLTASELVKFKETKQSIRGRFAAEFQSIWRARPLTEELLAYCTHWWPWCAETTVCVGPAGYL